MSESDGARPRGREQVAEAILVAAKRLFADRGPAATSLRDIAEAADVNVGLIHRHIGTKDDLLAAVLRERPGLGAVDSARDQLPLAEYLTFVLGRGFEQTGLARLHARLILDGYDLGELQDKFPAFDFLTAHFAKTVPDVEARLRAVFVACIVAGWGTFGSTYIRLADLDDHAVADLAAMLTPVLAALADAPPAATRRRPKRRPRTTDG